MTSDSGRGTRDDQIWPHAVQWDLGMGARLNSEVVWRCDALRAGKLYSRSLFGTKEEAEQFVAKMRESEPDQVFRVESILASAIWN